MRKIIYKYNQWNIYIYIYDIRVEEIRYENNYIQTR
jgi:hypothetical protein